MGNLILRLCLIKLLEMVYISPLSVKELSNQWSSYVMNICKSCEWNQLRYSFKEKNLFLDFKKKKSSYKIFLWVKYFDSSVHKHFSVLPLK